MSMIDGLDSYEIMVMCPDRALLDKIHYIEQNNDVLCNQLGGEHIQVKLPAIAYMEIVDGELMCKNLIIGDSKKVASETKKGLKITGVSDDDFRKSITEDELEQMMQQATEIHQDVDETLPSIAEWMKR